METRQITFTETVRIGRETYVENDVRTLPKSVADAYVDAGMARDTETGETGERVPGARGAVRPDKVTQEAT